MENKIETENNDTKVGVDTTPRNTKERGRCWLLTWNNYTEDDFKWLTQYCEVNCSEHVFQEEIGQNGTKHLQIFLEYSNPRYFNSVKDDLKKCHIEKVKNKLACKLYCQKKETRNGRTIKSGKAAKTPPKDPLEGKQLYDWQNEIINMMNEEPDDRAIFWYFDPTGNKGKTSLAKSLCIKYPKQVLYLSGKAADIKYGITQFIEKNELKMAIFDYTRSQEEYISYEALEAVKNGIFYNNKYESGMVVYNTPHVIVLSNFRPDLSKLSADRWRIKEVV